MKSERRVRWGAVVGFLLTAACGGGTPSEMPDESTDDGTGGTGGTDSATGGAATGGANGSATRTPSLRVQILNVPFRTAAPSVNVESSAKRPLTVPEPPDDLPEVPECERLEEGSCSLLKCPVSESPPVSEPTPTNPTPLEYIDAGALTVEFAADEGPITAVVPFANGYGDRAYFAPDYPLRGLEVGSLTFAGGADVSGFTEPLTQPLFLLMTNPSVEIDNAPGDFLRAIDVSRSAGITLNWERGAAGVSLLLQQRGGSASTATHSYRLRCQVDSTLGTLSLPPSLIGELPVGVEYDVFTAVFRERVENGVDVTLLHGSDVLVPERDHAVFLRVVP